MHAWRLPSAACTPGVYRPPHARLASTVRRMHAWRLPSAACTPGVYRPPHARLAFTVRHMHAWRLPSAPCTPGVYRPPAAVASRTSSRPMRKRRISLVPAPISYSLASRSSRPVGYSLM